MRSHRLQVGEPARDRSSNWCRAVARAAFPDGHIIDDGERRFAVSDTPADLAIRLDAIEYVRRITPTS
jgi:hypothetical protein